jgi:hypothetical protein
MNFDDASLKASKLNRLLCLDNKGESKFTFLCEKSQNQCTPIWIWKVVCKWNWKTI